MTAGHLVQPRASDVVGLQGLGRRRLVGRGHGIGRRLLHAMFDQMRADGYDTVRFSSARFLSHAEALYRSVGFHDAPHPPGFPEHLKSFVYFMERPLVPEG